MMWFACKDITVKEDKPPLQLEHTWDEFKTDNNNAVVIDYWRDNIHYLVFKYNDKIFVVNYTQDSTDYIANQKFLNDKN